MLKNSFYVVGLLISVLLSAGFAFSEELDLRLTGTITGRYKTFAFIEDIAKGEQGVYRSGDSLKEYRITKIIKDRVTLTKTDREIVLIIEGTDNPLDNPPLLPPLFLGEINPVISPYQEGIRGGVYKLATNNLADMFNNVSSYKGKVAVYQHRENGKNAGFRIRYLTDVEDFQKMGIENGDIIRKVNGLDINNASDFLKAAYKLSLENTFKVEVKRKSQKKILSYRLDERLFFLVPKVSNFLKMSEYSDRD